jgi:hypothetical protein
MRTLLPMYSARAAHNSLIIAARLTAKEEFFRIHLMDTRSVVFMLRHIGRPKIALSITTLETIRTQNDLRAVL